MRERVLSAIEKACHDDAGTPHVLVTHHPEEIMPCISHVLLLRGGRIVARGRREDVLTEGNLSAAYGLPLHVMQHGGRTWVVPRDADSVPDGV